MALDRGRGSEWRRNCQYSPVMEGKGAHNRHAKLPAGGASLALSLSVRAVRSVELKDDQPVVIADMDRHEGKTRSYPMQVAIVILRARLNPDSTLIDRRTTLTLYLKSWILNPPDTPSADQTYFRGSLDCIKAQACEARHELQNNLVPAQSNVLRVERA